MTLPLMKLLAGMVTANTTDRVNVEHESVAGNAVARLKDSFCVVLLCIGRVLPMQSGELGGRHPSATAVRANLVVVLPPSGDCCPGLGKGLEPMVVQAFVPELVVKALDLAVLHWPARFDQDVANVMGLCPAHERSAGEFGSVVGAHHIWVAAKQRRLISQILTNVY
jgi:hypothetical protein